ncbi:MAG: AraC family transcriptional regulator [Ignavibacteria bacterium]|nr:AraC family transcriptional regulator [Ignavibacteria bacterium]
MEYLHKGKYYGIPQKVLNYDDIIITDNEYIKSKVGWHYHENVYFTYILKGRLIESSKTETHNCMPGTLLYHNRQEPHYNIKPPGYTRGFQVEFSKDWFTKHSVKVSDFEGSSILTNPLFNHLFNRIYRESFFSDEDSLISIEVLLLQVFGVMMRRSIHNSNERPVWISTIESILNDRFKEKITLEFLAKETGIHPVHISQVFSKYFDSSFGDYLRKIRIGKAINLIADGEHTLTQISSMCGFSDQSHFIRIFKSLYGISPSLYRKSIKIH